MVKNMKKKKNKINKRIELYTYVIIAIFLAIATSLFHTIYVEEDEHKLVLEKITNVIVEGRSAPRGRIYDRNYKLLVDNESVPIIVYKKKEGITTKEEIDLAYKTINHIEVDYNKISPRNLKEFYLTLHDNEISKRITDEEYDKLERRILTRDDIYNLKMDRITKEDLSTLTEEDKKTAYLYYMMKNGYSYEEHIIKENVSDEEYSYFAENEHNETGFYTSITWKRKYLYGNTLKQIIGSVGKITKEDKTEYLSKGYSLNDIVGKSYVEKQYENILKGKKSTYLKTSSSNLEKLTEEERGKDIVLTIDIDLQIEVEKILEEELSRAKKEANTNYFNKSYVVIQKPNTGEVLAIAGKQIIKSGQDERFIDVVTGVLTDPMTPGSVVKGGSMLVGYTTNNLQIGEVMTDECIKFKFTPAKCSSHRVGKLDDIKALAESSNVYQFKIAMRVGGANYKYNESINISDESFDIYRSMFASLGLGVKTEIDLPKESIGYIGKKKSPDLLLNLAIGQYDTYTPIQLSQYITTLASNGNRLKPHLLKEIRLSSKTEEIGDLEKEITPVVLNKVEAEQIYLDRVKEGFKAVVSYGTGKNVMGNAPNPAGKTGTSESFLDTDNDGKIDTETISNAFVGYAPSDNPEMTITVTSPDVEDPNTNINYHSYVNRRITKKISNFYFTSR